MNVSFNCVKKISSADMRWDCDMPKLIYVPKALDDLSCRKYLTEQVISSYGISWYSPNKDLIAGRMKNPLTDYKEGSYGSDRKSGVNGNDLQGKRKNESKARKKTGNKKEGEEKSIRSYLS